MILSVNAIQSLSYFSVPHIPVYIPALPKPEILKKHHHHLQLPPGISSNGRLGRNRVEAIEFGTNKSQKGTETE
jgi:hypothetical protein